MSYQVTGPCVIVTSAGPAGGQRITLYAPAMLPPDVPQAEIEHLLSVGLIAKVGGPAPAAKSAPMVEPAVVQETPDVPAASGPVEKPAQGDKKDVWVAYAVSQGADPDEAEKSSKADLIDAYGK